MTYYNSGSGGSLNSLDLLLLNYFDFFQFHPDVRNTDASRADEDECNFWAVNEAYSILGRIDRKRIYDLGLHKEESKKDDTYSPKSGYKDFLNPKITQQIATRP